MDEFMEMDDTRSIIKSKLRQYFDGKIVRKDLTKHIKEGANVPVYVLEFFPFRAIVDTRISCRYNDKRICCCL